VGSDASSTSTQSLTAPFAALSLHNARSQVAWLPPTSSGCFSSFVVSAKDVGTGKWLPTQTVESALRTQYKGLTSGATYEFSVQAVGAAGKKSGWGESAKAALPPSFLYVRADAPTELKAVALSDSSAKLTWALPPGNPKVDSYEVTAVPTNATGFPLKSGKNLTSSAQGWKKELTVYGLSPDSYYVRR